MTTNPEGAPCVFFSIIVPTRDRLDALEACLASLAALDYPRDRYDVTVVDDGGARSPAALVEGFSPRLDVEFISLEHAGPAAARNAGVERSGGEYLAFIDDDCEADTGWLKALNARLTSAPGSAIGGRVVNALTSNPYARASQGLQDFLYKWYHMQRRGELRFFTTNNLAVARSDFDAIGGFDESFAFASEDRDWCDRYLHAGSDLVYAPEAVVRHSHQLDFGAFIHQHVRYGQGAVRFHQTRARRRGGRVKLEPLAFYGGMLASPFAGSDPHPVRGSLLLIASQSASLVGFAKGWKARRN